MKEEIIKGLKEDGRYEIDGVGVIEMLPRRKGKTFCGFRNKEGTPIYKKRLRFTSFKSIKDEICK